MKFGIGVIYKMLYKKREFNENWGNGSHIVGKGAKRTAVFIPSK